MIGNIKVTDYQNRILEIPESLNVIADGGKGSGKTFGFILEASRHAELYGDRAHVLCVRESVRSAREWEDEVSALAMQAFPKSSHNRQDHFLRLSSGGVIEWAPLRDANDFAALAGRSFSLILADEVGNWATQAYLWKLQGNLRAGVDTPTRMMCGANPAGRQHSVLQQKFLSKAPPWTPFEVDGIPWIRAPGCWLDNRENLPADYPARVLAAAGKDKALAKAWLEGRWDILKGSMFADVLSEERQMIDSRSINFVNHPTALCFVAGDWGQAAPTAAYACARLNEPMGYFPRGSLILLDEITTADPEDLSVGIPTAPGAVAESIIRMTDRNFGEGRGRRGVFDQARGLGADETLLKFFQGFGLHFVLPPKSRTQGWAKLRDLFTNSHERNGRPGFWATEKCSAFWATAPSCPRDERNPEDVDTRSNDHFLDAARYSATAQIWQPPIKQRRQATWDFPTTFDNMTSDQAMRLHGAI